MRVLSDSASAALIEAGQKAAEDTSKHRSSVLDDVAARAKKNKSLRKADIAALAFWKGMNAGAQWVPKFLDLKEKDVEKATAKAYKAANKSSLHVSEAAAKAYDALSELPGFENGDVLTSAVVLACAPKRMAIFDSSIEAGLKKADLELPAGPQKYADYLGLLREMRRDLKADGHDWTAHEVAAALSRLGRE